MNQLIPSGWFFGGEHDFARLGNRPYTTLNLVRSLPEAGGA